MPRKPIDEPAEIAGPIVAHAAPHGLPGLIRTVSAATPDAVAVLDEHRTLTYRQLELVSDRLARRIGEQCPDPARPVGVCLPRGCAMVVALLAVLKAGRYYLPIDPAEPPVRREAILRRARPALVVTEADVTLTVDQDDHDDQDGRPAPLAAVAPDLPVYVLFTSGSTGEPKGVVLSSAALCNRLQWMREHYGFGPADRILQKTPLTFDVAGWEIFAPLISGGCCVLAAPGAHRDPAALIETIVAHEVTVTHFVPSMLAEFVVWPGADRCVSLRLVVASGEPLSATLVRRFSDLLPARLDNLYGPTEAAIDVTHWRCGPGEVLIGLPVDNCVLTVLDDDGQPVEEGELHIGGVPLAIGYLDQPELTERKFVPAPSWCSVPRLYRTGDRVRRHPGGLQYLGRVDDQVKIRGHRVEPQEVEHQLRTHPALTDAAVVAASAGETQLVAFLLGKPIERNTLADWLADRVPRAFQPAEFRFLPALPHLPSGKVDRARLRRLAEQILTTSSAESSDGDSLTRAWCAALRQPTADATVRFSQAGGHSLAALRLISEIERHGGQRISLADLLRLDPTLDELRGWLHSWSPPAALPPRADPETAPLGADQRPMWRLLRFLSSTAMANVYAIMIIDGEPDTEVLRTALVDLVARHESLRSTIETTPEGEPYQRIWPECPVTVHHRQAREPLDRTTITDFGCQIRDTDFDCGTLPLFAVGVLSSAAERRWVLAVSLDHRISDQVSVDIFLDELAEFYLARLTGQDARLTPLPAQAGDLAEWQANKPHRADDLVYWRTQLAGAPQPPLWPFTVPDTATFAATATRRELTNAQSESLDECMRQLGSTAAATFLACMAMVLAGHAGTSDLLVSVLVSVREPAEAHALIGNFVRMTPIRIRLDPAAGLTSALPGVQETLVDAVTHLDVVFDEVAQQLQAETGFTGAAGHVWFNDLTEARFPVTFGGSPATPFSLPRQWLLAQPGMTVRRTATGRYQLEFAYPLRLITEADAEHILDATVEHLLSLPRAEGRAAAHTIGVR